MRSAYGSSTDRRHSYGSKGVFTMSFDTVIAFATAGGLLATTAQLALQLIQNSRDSKAVQEKIRKIELSEKWITDYKTLTLSKIGSKNARVDDGKCEAAYPVNSGSSICSVLSDRPRSVAGTYTDGQGALAF